MSSGRTDPPPEDPRVDPLVATLRAAGCVFAEEEAALLLEAAGGGADLADLTARRVAGEPLEHVLGWVAFDGLRLRVDAGVFVPRARTVALVDAAAAALRAGAAPVVVDLCCGCGAIGAALAARVPGLTVHAADVSAVAVACARRNLAPRGRVHLGDLFAPLPASLRGTVGVLVANVPYVPTDAVATMPREARDHEPASALDGGADGLDVQRRVAAQAAGWLARGGHVLVETSAAQAPTAAAAFSASGLEPYVVEDEETGTTVVGAVAGGG